MSDATCVFCGYVPDVTTYDQLEAHLASESHRAMVELANDLDARVYVPKDEPK